MITPVQNGYITSDFDAHVARGVKGSFGYDIGSKEQPTTIYAPFGGRVVSSNDSATFGNRVWVKITDKCKYEGQYFVCAHMKSIDENIEDGIYINAGSKLGIMGTTGMSQAIHLHFEIRTSPGINGVSIRCDEILQILPYKK